MARQSRLQSMGLRILTLLCAVLIASVHYGMRVWLLCLTAVVASMVSEFVCLYLCGKPFRLWHLEAAADGLVLTLLMPASLPYHTLIISCIGANIIGRHILGGEAKPLMPTAAIGCCIAYCGWQESVMSYPAMQKLPLFTGAAFETVKNRTAMWYENLQFEGDALQWLAYQDGLPMGSGSLLLLIVIAVILVLHRCANAGVLIGTVIPIAAAAALHGAYLGWSAAFTASAAYAMCGALVFAAVYLAGDFRLQLSGGVGFLYGLLVSIGSMLPSNGGFSAVFIAMLSAPIAVSASRWLTSDVRKERAANEQLCV